MKWLIFVMFLVVFLVGCSGSVEVITSVPAEVIAAPTERVVTSSPLETTSVVTQTPPTSVPSQTPTEQSKYTVHEDVTATVFWGGELPDEEENDNMSNIPFAWCKDQIKCFGGVDTPDDRDPGNPYYPEGFVPLENPFYIALPAAEYDEEGLIPLARESSYWWEESVPDGESLFKNRWVEVRLGDRSCFGQWEDVGPGNDRQYDYVFGNARTENTFGLGAGIDLSPAMAICLGADSKHTSSWSGIVSWRFVEQENIPVGPWLEIITTSGPKW